MSADRIAVVVPALDEEQRIEATLRSVRDQDAGVEIVVVDGGSRDATREIAARHARVVPAPRGRARQLAAGVAATDAGVLLFLHADTLLPPGALARVREALEDPLVVGGGFLKRFDGRSRWLRGAARRTRWWFRLGAVFGDQAPFVRRAALEAVGGLRADAIEDLDLSLRLRSIGRLALIDLEVVTSSRRLEARGVLRTWLAWWRLGVAQWVRTQADLWRERGRRRSS